jgi:ribonuclease P protein component
MRLSQANEDCQRASNHQSPSSDRSQATLRLRNRFPKAARLRTRQEFKRVQREGKRILAQFLVFQYASENFNCLRLGITVSKQFGSSVSRNLFKRRVREAFRTLHQKLSPELKPKLNMGLKIHVSPRQGAGQPTLKQVEEDFAFMLHHIKTV